MVASGGTAYLKTLAFEVFATPAFILGPDKIVVLTSSPGSPSARKVKRGPDHGAELMTLP